MLLWYQNHHHHLSHSYQFIPCVEATLAAVIPKSTGYFLIVVLFVGIPFIISPAAAAAAASASESSLFTANAAQQLHNVGFVLIDGAFEGGVAPTAGRRLKYNNKSAANEKHKCAPVFCIHVSFACNQQLAHCRATTTGSEMQSGELETRSEN